MISVRQQSVARPAGERIIIALDVDNPGSARQIVNELKDQVGAFKIGLQLFSCTGGAFVRELADAGVKVFLDLKFHDIPNTVSKASVEAAKMGAWMFNVHAAGGTEMMERAVSEMQEFCTRSNIDVPKMIAVTVLTSTDANSLREVGIINDVDRQVLLLAKLASECGLDGVVASSHEAAAIKQEIGQDLLVVTPGIRPKFGTNDDQKRVNTPTGALLNGSDLIVIGRPVTEAAERSITVKEICREIEAILR
ncbi:MAG: orotidine-5'-phosphate decarboxylase [Acidobacteriota bacterium]